MRVGIEYKVFNFVVRDKRKAMGITQIQLASDCNASVQFIQDVELLRSPRGKFPTIKQRLHAIANVLELDFDECFPPEYLNAIQQKILPRRRTPLVWAGEIRINELPDSDKSLLSLPGPEEGIVEQDFIERLPDALATALDKLHPNHRKAIVLRYGLEGEPPMSYEEIGERMGYTGGRYPQQLVDKALRLLRHPYRSVPLREYLHG